MAEYVVGSKAAAQHHRERKRQRKAKLASRYSEGLEEEDGERVDGGDEDSACDGESGGSSETVKKGTKAVKKRTTAINLSHLDEEELGGYLKILRASYNNYTQCMHGYKILAHNILCTKTNNVIIFGNWHTVKQQISA